MSGPRVKKYHQIADALRGTIQSGNLAPGQKLASETALAERFQVSVPTVRQAMGVLEQEGVIVRKHGVGTFVAEESAITLDGLRTAMSSWLTRAMSIEPGPSVVDLGDLRDWIDGGCAGDMPWPETKE